MRNSNEKIQRQMDDGHGGGFGGWSGKCVGEISPLDDGRVVAVCVTNRVDMPRILRQFADELEVVFAPTKDSR